MLTKIFTSIVLLLALLQVQPASGQKQRMNYIGKDNYIVPSRNDAQYYRIVRERLGDTLFDYLEYYFSDQIKVKGKIRNWDGPPQYADTLRSYYENGQTKSVSVYKDGQRFGDGLYYYSNGELQERWTFVQKTNEVSGQLETENLLMDYRDSLGKVMVENGNGDAVFHDQKAKEDFESGTIKDGKREGIWKGSFNNGAYTFVEEYKNGELLHGESSNLLGLSKKKYNKVMVGAEYPGGLRKLYQYIGKNFRFPREAVVNGVQGVVVLEFVVDRTGDLQDIEVREDLGFGTGAEAARVLEKSGKWNPGQHRGVDVRVSYSLPVRLNLGK